MARAELNNMNCVCRSPTQLFQSMVSVRPQTIGSEPHLGFGLYIAHLIAEYHGAVTAENRKDGAGVIVTVCLALI